MLSEIVARRPVKSIDEVLGLMGEIDGALAEDDGLWWFNRLYRAVTLAVRDAAASTGTFADAQFIEQMDVVFANLYFDAVAAGAEDPNRAPSAWRPLLAARHERNRAPLQFALAGMNAHINRDLPHAIVRTFTNLGGSPEHGDPRHADYVRVNRLLEQVEATVKTEFSRGLVRLVDEAAGDTDDVIAMWNVRVAREAAWANAEVLWTLRHVPLVRDRFVKSLDRLTGFAGRGLLTRLF